MEFSNLFFLYIFLPLGLCIYFLTPEIRGKNIVLLILSFLFYGYGDLRALPLMLSLGICNYYFGIKIQEHPKFFVLSLLLNIGALFACKVFLNKLPLGISFFSFSLISYCVDLYQKKTKACDSLLSFLLFVSFFPKLLMGPIVRYDLLSARLTSREHSPKLIFQGTARFFLGLGSKILLADPLYNVYAQLTAQNSALSAWGAALCFMLYIYFEFSGYAHMAIGLGKIFGFTLPENFQSPYTAATVSDFWRRWHMSLGSFFRDYVYIPLGGNRKGIYRQWLNLLVVWILTGLWHGFTFPFVLWGIYYFILSILEKTWSKAYLKVPKWIRLLLTQFFVLLGWVIFAAGDSRSLYYSIVKLFLPSSEPWQIAAPVLRNSILLLAVSVLIALFGARLEKYFCKKFSACTKNSRRIFALCSMGVILFGILVLCTAALLSGNAKPSMYASF